MSEVKMSEVIISEVKMSEVEMSEVIMSELKTEILFQLLILYSVIIYLINMAEFSSLYNTHKQKQTYICIHNLSSFIFPEYVKYAHKKN